MPDSFHSTEAEGVEVTGREASPFVGPLLMVQTGGGSVMFVSRPDADPHLEWSLRYGSPDAVRFQAAAVVESFDYLLSDNINMTEATRRLRLLRAAIARAQGAA